MAIPAITGPVDHDKAYDVFPERLKPYRSTILAYSASIVQTFVGFPMDTVKVKMQAYRSFKGYGDCIRSTYRADGIRGFYRGILSPLLLTSLVRTLNVGIFSNCKPAVARGVSRVIGPEFSEKYPYIANVPICFLLGATAGFSTTFISCPFEYLKVVMQLEELVIKSSLNSFGEALKTGKSVPYKAPLAPPLLLSMVRLIVKYDGPSGLYLGLKYHAARDAIGSGVYFSTYELGKSIVNRLITGSPLQLTPVLVLLAGGLSGVFGWLFIYPIDTMKQRYQKGRVNNIFRRRQGLPPKPINPGKLAYNRDMFRGLGISMARTFIVNMMFFSMYEMTMSKLV